jgi:hypothetical protein
MVLSSQRSLLELRSRWRFEASARSLCSWHRLEASARGMAGGEAVLAPLSCPTMKVPRAGCRSQPFRAWLPRPASPWASARRSIDRVSSCRLRPSPQRLPPAGAEHDHDSSSDALPRANRAHVPTAPYGASSSSGQNRIPPARFERLSLIRQHRDSAVLCQGDSGQRGPVVTEKI